MTNYDKRPSIEVTREESDCAQGWPEVLDRIAAAAAERQATRIAVECYPGTNVDHIRTHLATCFPSAKVLSAEDYLKPPAVVEKMVAPFLTDDPVFGWMKSWQLRDFFAEEKLVEASSIAHASADVVLVVGTGASLILPDTDLLIYADCPRWEIQLRQRQHLVGNLGAGNHHASAAEIYKRAYFIDWRAADALKLRLLQSISLYLDATSLLDSWSTYSSGPGLISGEMYREGLAIACRRPFRVVPFFDPGPWGGQWMRRHFDLPEGPPNFAWCFDCVPEENSVLFGFGSRHIESPSLTIVHQHPRELLGESVYQRFGAEFPIRFDLLDTVQGGNLSLQVHPVASYIAEKFGMPYTQDESYYMLDAGPGAVTYLGLKEKIDRQQMIHDLREAQTGGAPFPADRYVNLWPAKKHDHFSIPAGTIHCSGSNGMVLEISATPYIFTFKLWDWSRLGLNGKPRPIHLDHGIANLQWDRTTRWVRENLVNPVRQVAAGEGWREEATGLHELEFLETRRHWFTSAVDHHTNETVNVLNLVEGAAAIVSSPDGGFEDFEVHYAETFIVPAAVGPYTIRPAAPATTPMATMKAYVRDES